MPIKEYEVCLFIQRALLDAVTPMLRRVSFDLNENLVNLYFYYDGTPSALEVELSGNVEAEVVSDLPDPYKINCNLINVKYPTQIQSKGRIVYNRYEV